MYTKYVTFQKMYLPLADPAAAVAAVAGGVNLALALRFAFGVLWGCEYRLQVCVVIHLKPRVPAYIC